MAKNKQTTTVSPAAAALSALVDEYGELEKTLAPYAAAITRRETVGKAIRQHFDNSPAHLPCVATGQKYQCLVSERSMQSNIDVATAFDAMGRAKFLQACSLTVKALDEALTPALAARLITKVQTGYRKIVVSGLPQS